MKKKVKIPKNKTTKRRQKKSGSAFWQSKIFIFIILGIVILGSGFFLFRQVIKPKIKDYYSSEVFKMPQKGFVLGEKTEVYQIPILLYHYVEYNKDPNDTIRMSLTIRRDIFEQQIKDLIARNYSFLTVAEAGEIIDKKIPKPEKLVVLSFDDGYRDFYTDILPILQFYNVKATLFVVSEFLNHSNNVTDEQLKEIIQSDLVEIGGHTFNHRALTSLSSEGAYQEIKEDKDYLEKNFNIHLTSFAYPYGSFDKESVEQVKKAGYKQAVSVVLGNKQSEENRFFMFRIRPGRLTGDVLDKLLNEDR